MDSGSSCWTSSVLSKDRLLLDKWDVSVVSLSLLLMTVFACSLDALFEEMAVDFLTGVLKKLETEPELFCCVELGLSMKVVHPESRCELILISFTVLEHTGQLTIPTGRRGCS